MCFWKDRKCSWERMKTGHKYSFLTTILKAFHLMVTNIEGCVGKDEQMKWNNFFLCSKRPYCSTMGVPAQWYKMLFFRIGDRPLKKYK